jgi:hypothetical protein
MANYFRIVILEGIQIRCHFVFPCYLRYVWNVIDFSCIWLLPYLLNTQGMISPQ